MTGSLYQNQITNKCELFHLHLNHEFYKSHQAISIYFLN